MIEIGLYTLADIMANPFTGKTSSAGQRVKEIIEAAKLADEAGLDIFGVGEHHRLDYAISSPPVVLASIAQITKRIKLTIVEKILRQYELFGHQRFMAQLDIGGVPFEKVAKSIELLATEVAPIVRKATV